MCMLWSRNLIFTFFLLDGRFSYHQLLNTLILSLIYKCCLYCMPSFPYMRGSLSGPSNLSHWSTCQSLHKYHTAYSLELEGKFWSHRGKCTCSVLSPFELNYAHKSEDSLLLKCQVFPNWPTDSMCSVKNFSEK